MSDSIEAATEVACSIYGISKTIILKSLHFKVTVFNFLSTMSMLRFKIWEFKFKYLNGFH